MSKGAGTNNCIPHYLCDVITCPCPRYLLLSYKTTCVSQWYWIAKLWATVNMSLICFIPFFIEKQEIQDSSDVLDRSVSGGELKDGFLQCTLSRKVEYPHPIHTFYSLYSPNEYHLVVAKGVATGPSKASQIAKTIWSTSIRYRSHAVSDRCLIDGNPGVFAIWDHLKQKVVIMPPVVAKCCCVLWNKKK